MILRFQTDMRPYSKETCRRINKFHFWKIEKSNVYPMIESISKTVKNNYTTAIRLFNCYTKSTWFSVIFWHFHIYYSIVFNVTQMPSIILPETAL